MNLQDWPARPDFKAPLERTAAEARSSSAATPPTEPRTSTPAPAGGLLASLATLAGIIAVPVALWLCAWALIDLMTQVPLLIVGACLVVAGVLMYALHGTTQPWRLDDDDCCVITSLRLKR